jgi:hypothetical protein
MSCIEGYLAVKRSPVTEEDNVTRLEKQSWYGLAVAALMALAVGTLYALTGSVLRSMAGFAVMALWAFTPVVGSSGSEPKIKEVKASQIWGFWGSVALATIITLFVAWGTHSRLVIVNGILLVAFFWWMKRCLFSPGSRMHKYDEREQAVIQKAARVGFVVFWILFVLSNTSIPFLHPQPIPSYLFVWEVLMGFWVMIVGTSLATLWRERADG